MLQEHRSTAQKQRHTEAQREAAKRETGKHEAEKKQAKTLEASKEAGKS